MGDGMMNGSNSVMGWGGMFFGPLMMFGFLALIILTIVALVKWISGGDSGAVSFNSSHNSSLTKLNERLAAGEIDGVEYENIKRQMTA